MATVIICSRKFPVKHPKSGQDTFFVEKIWQSLYLDGKLDLLLGCEVLKKEHENFCNPHHHILPKGHTIRAGRRWKAGMKFSPRVWSGKPYCSKQIAIAPDLELTKVYDIEIFDIGTRYMTVGVEIKKNEWYLLPLAEVAKNDGLSIEDFESWFRVHTKRQKHPNEKETFVGQILCWTNKVNYDKKVNLL